MKVKILAIATLTMICCLAHAKEPSWKTYNALLKKHVVTQTYAGITSNMVDYAALRKSGELNRVVQELESFNMAQLSSKAERMAFFINAYNIYAIKMVVDHWPLQSIRDVGSFFNPVWKKPIGQLNGSSVSLDRIEHKILRPMNEPRIHFAIVCASLSCPDLRKEAYTAARLDEQLNSATILFVKDPYKGVRKTQRGLLISKIFDWFEEDFEPNGVRAFIGEYRKSVNRLPVNGYIEYHWGVNAKR